MEQFANGGGMRADVDELLKQHAVPIAELQKKLAAVLSVDKDQYDEIFLLRYVLSHRAGGKADLEKAEDCIRQTIEWRKKEKAKIDESAKTGFGPNHDIAIRFNTVGHAGNLPGGGEPVYVVRTGYCDLPGLMNTLTHEQVVDWLHYTKEKVWRDCDTRTRKTRRLTKEISVIDMENFSLFGGDKRFYKCLGDASKLSAVYYPQLLGKTVMINTPSFFRMLYNTFSIFMPKSALEKQTLCPAKNTSKEDISACPFMKRFNGIGSVPAFLGGTLPCPPSLVAREDREKQLQPLTISSRAKKTVDLDISFAPARVKWEFMLEAYGLRYSAQFTESSTGNAEASAPIGTTVLPEFKMRAEDGLRTGFFDIEKPGIVTFTFDNGDSRFRGKTINYHLEVVAPPNEKE
jgi:hypothetical protein